ncbi:MAG: UDP-glucose 4-epimerase GalE [Phascolarctobacterium sp.]|uniref:UDP-glucose 4-epimerase GalE n=1 Tax=Phascolarctobacterium sp. TaxID=2049039 RepID=UPI0026DA8C24|nr:UDP-glucose 4-epimerase GalE [Phascolarctobacterium sp.]MDO4920590.1 UDP-glucose 4-epimerase GalE [Phascolarctobacterium sp.]
MNILVTGGAGYIGSHVVEELQKSGFTPIVYDNFSTGHAAAVPEDVQLVEGDIHDVRFARHIMEQFEIDAVIHFAASSLVGESMVDPAKYYFNNVEGSLHLLEAMRGAGVDRIVFSSTAAVYGEPEQVPITEDSKLQPTNVYGRSKLMIEKMLADYDMAYDFRYVALRYFNAAGASPTRDIGEDHSPESHLIPLILKTAQGVRKQVAIFGTDYPTEDGTCIRDYIHVCDLAKAHVLALQHLLKGGDSRVYNLGSENGFSVRQMIDCAKKVTAVDFTVVEETRRAGDPAVLIASSEKIRSELGWVPQHSSVEEVIGTAWKWHKGHPHGYEG